MAGQGSITVNQKKENPVAPGPPGPPFLITSADNGLSVDPVSFRIVLGNDNGGAPTAVLLSPREIPLATNFIRFTDATGDVVISDTEVQATNSGTSDIASMRSLTDPELLLQSGLGLNESMSLFNRSGEFTIESHFAGDPRMLSLDHPNGQYIMGDIDNSANSSYIGVFDTTGIVQAASHLGIMMNLDHNNDIYSYGDLSAFANSNQVVLDDANQIFTYIAGSNTYLNASVGNNQYQFGDITPTSGGNNTYLDIYDFGSIVQVFTGGGAMLELDGNNSFQMGDLSVINNGNRIHVDDGTGQFEYVNPLGQYLLLDNLAGVYRLGDITPTAPGNNNYIDIDDTNEIIQVLQNTNPTFYLDNLNQIYSFRGALGTNITIDESFSGVTVSATAGLSCNTSISAATTLRSGSPGLGAGAWRLGTFQAGAVVPDVANYVEISIGGVVRKLIVST